MKKTVVNGVNGCRPARMTFSSTSNGDFRVMVTINEFDGDAFYPVFENLSNGNDVMVCVKTQDFDAARDDLLWCTKSIDDFQVSIRVENIARDHAAVVWFNRKDFLEALHSIEDDYLHNKWDWGY